MNSLTVLADQSATICFLCFLQEFYGVKLDFNGFQKKPTCLTLHDMSFFLVVLTLCGAPGTPKPTYKMLLNGSLGVKMK